MKKSILEIQQEIRNLEGKVKDISSTIASIYGEIDELRNDDEAAIDFDMIRLMSKQLAFGEHPIENLKDAFARQMYLKALLSVVYMDHGSESTVDRLIFIQYILSCSHLKQDLDSLYKSAMTITAESFGDIVEAVPKRYWEYLIVDLLITANIGGTASESLLMYIACFCSVVGVDKKSLQALSSIAINVLMQGAGKMKDMDFRDFLNISNSFRHYLDDKLLGVILQAQRSIVVEVPDTDCSDFKWKVKQSAQVKEGDVIATYNSPIHSALKSRADKKAKVKKTEVIAPCGGTVFQFRDSNTNYGVISHETDNKDKIKAWVIQKR